MQKSVYYLSLDFSHFWPDKPVAVESSLKTSVLIVFQFLQ